MAIIGHIAQRLIKLIGLVLASAVILALFIGATEASGSIAQASPISTVDGAAVVEVANTARRPRGHYENRGAGCRYGHNRVCGPNSGAAAGCYRNGQLVIPWTNYREPWHDPLYGRFTPPC